MSKPKPSVDRELAAVGITLEHVAKIEAITGVCILRVTERTERTRRRATSWRPAPLDWHDPLLACNMTPILDTNKLDDAERELGTEPGGVEQLLTPLTRYAKVRPGRAVAIDNGAFTRFNAEGFVSLLEREKPRRDPAGRRRARTWSDGPPQLECFEHWGSKPLAPRPSRTGRSLAYPWHRSRRVHWRLAPSGRGATTP